MKKCPSCGRSYSNLVQQCSACHVPLQDLQARQKSPAVEYGGTSETPVSRPTSTGTSAPPQQPPISGSNSGGGFSGTGYSGSGSSGNHAAAGNIPVTYANRHQFQPTPEEEFIISAYGADCGIKKYIGNRSMVVIPAKIRGHRVISIDQSAFWDFSPVTINRCKVETVIIPETVSTIGVAAFWFCRRLKTVIAHPGIEVLKMHAFGNCLNIGVLDFGVRPAVPGVLYLPPDMKRIGCELFIDYMKVVAPFQEVWLSRNTKLETSLGMHKSFTPKLCAMYYYEDDRI